MERKLAAILAVDAVGYSRLMAGDEAGTHQRLQSVMREVLGPNVAAHGGRVVKLMGDGALADFPSVVNSLACAVAIQNAMALREADLPADRQIRLRIGINLGDIISEDGDIFGDGVNIAARLEALAEPGGICLSGAAFDTIEGKFDFSFVDMGPQSVKNIARPVRAYRVDLSASRAEPAPAERTATAQAGKPSIAVLPFANLSSDPDQQYFADGMSEDIITNLSKCRWIFVIARNSAFRYRGEQADSGRAASELGVRYVLEGSVRRSATQIRISCQLLDAASGAHLWAERYDDTLTDIFELQDEITRKVVAALEPTLKLAEIQRIKRKRPEYMDAYELYLRALESMYDVRPQARAAAIEFARRALAIDPGYAEAHGVAAWCYFAKSLWEGSLPDPHREAMLAHARAVQELNCDDASTLAHAAISLSLATQDHSGALAMIERAIAINPSSAHAYGHGSVINTWAGNYDRSIALSEMALRLSPFDPLRVMPLAGQAGARLMKGEFEDAANCAQNALQCYATHTPSFLILIASLARLGRLEAARQAAERLMEVSPGYRIIPRAPVLEHFIRELRESGLPG